jgi:hypothetical protein
LIKLEANDCFVKGAKIQGSNYNLARGLIRKHRNIEANLKMVVPTQNNVISESLFLLLPLRIENLPAKKGKKSKMLASEYY